MRLGNDPTFWLWLERVNLLPHEAKSSAARSLARLQVWCAGQNLCAGRDEAGAFDTLEVPLIDLATWLVEGWDERLYGASLHEVLATRFQYRVPIAARWELSSSLALAPGEAESLHEWASFRALEFAATDYLLPNIVFDRIDDFIRVSWSQRADVHEFVDTSFSSSQGTVLVDARYFVMVFSELVRLTFQWTKDLDYRDDTRVAQLLAFLQRRPEETARRAIQRWLPGLDVGNSVPAEELRALGETGRGGAVAAFLRSSDQVLAADAVRKCLSLFATTTSRVDRDRLSALTTGASAEVDPSAPWESGLHLARHVRVRLAEMGMCTPDERVPIEQIVSSLGVTIHQLDLETSNVDGVCLQDEDTRALAIVNQGGRLSSTLVGRRSTLAHELCHFLFDAPRFQSIGQTDLRRFSDSILEKRANAFAAELLLPRAVILGFAGGYALPRNRLSYLTRKFGVGMQLAVHQAENAGICLT